MKPLIVDVRRNSLDDGPGIRTVIFFKGCPLSCVWCQNPETKSASQEISFIKSNCANCKKCLEVCESKAIDFNYKFRIFRDKCNLCGKCIDECQNDAFKFAGKYYEIKDLVALILKDKTFYSNSGGGATFSGGEPTFHMEYLNKLLIELKKENIHICLETCGYFNGEIFNNFILPYIDLIYFDLKIFDPKLHLKYCKVPNQIILNNFEQLIKIKKIEILPRIPLIPKITTTKDNLINLANYLKTQNIKKLALLPYNPLWISKTEIIGIKPEYKRTNSMNQKEKGVIKEIFSEFEYKGF
jgi:pyruvate formate lyase activating enzyme